jgi:hypothetical protein
MKQTHRHSALRRAVPLLAALAALTGTATASAASVTPVFVPGNKTCADLGYGTLERKFDNPSAGKHTSSAPPAGPGIELTISDDRQFASFTSVWGVDAVLVKGGENENAYVYAPPSTGDTGLRAPDNNGGNQPDISHVSFCYRPHGTFRIVKDADPDTATDFAFTTGSGTGTALAPTFALDDDADATLENTWDSGWVAAGDYTVTEGTTAGWQLDGLSCDDAATARPSTVSGATATVKVDAGDPLITCTYRNVPAPGDPPGTVAIKKLTDPGTSTETFDFEAGAGVADIADLGHDDTSAAQSVAAGTYTFTETQVDGWDMTGLDCDDADSGGSTDPPAGSTTEAGTISFVVAAGEDVVCTVTNTQNGTLVAEKQTDPDETGGTAFAFSTTAPGGAFSLADDGVESRSVAPGTYTVTEDAASGYALSGIACEPGGSGDTATRTATYVIEPGETVRCTFTNTKDAPAPLVTPPGGVAAAAQSLQPAPAPQPVRQVAASRRASPGAARLQGPSGCATRPFTIRIRGRAIRQVVVSVGGRRIRTLRARSAQSGDQVLSVRIDPRDLRAGRVHRVTARVTFTTASGTRARTLRLAFQRCRAAQRPTFTG